MLLSLIYMSIFILSYFATVMVLALVLCIFTRDPKGSAKIGAWITQILYLAYFLYLINVVNPLGITLQ